MSIRTKPAPPAPNESCDRCIQLAKISVELPNGHSLVFCFHHYDLTPPVKRTDWSVNDPRG
jgi:hypothetical protein